MDEMATALSLSAWLNHLLPLATALLNDYNEAEYDLGIHVMLRKCFLGAFTF